MFRTLADSRRRIALLFGILLSLTVAAPALADTARTPATDAGFHAVGCVVAGTDGVEWTIVLDGACIDVDIRGVEWT